jgi:hypothetical protein
MSKHASEFLQIQKKIMITVPLSEILGKYEYQASFHHHHLILLLLFLFFLALLPGLDDDITDGSPFHFVLFCDKA